MSSKVDFKTNDLCSFFLLLCFFMGCAKPTSGGSAAETVETLHVNLSLRASTMLLDSTDTQLTELTVQRFSCPDASEPTDYILRQVEADKMFVLNESRELLEGCTLRVRSIKLKLNQLNITFDALKDTFTPAGTSETVLANSSKTAFLNVIIPSKISVASDKNIFWPLVVSYVDTKSRLFPLMVEAREPDVSGLGLVVSRIEDRGTTNSIWREFGVSLSCTGPQSLGSCNGVSLIGSTARFVLQSDVDLGEAQQIRYRGGIFDLLFTAGLTHLVGSGLRFTLNMPLAYFGQPLFLILMKGQSYSVFKIPPELVPAANTNQ